MEVESACNCCISYQLYREFQIKVNNPRQECLAEAAYTSINFCTFSTETILYLYTAFHQRTIKSFLMSKSTHFTYSRSINASNLSSSHHPPLSRPSIFPNRGRSHRNRLLSVSFNAGLIRSRWGRQCCAQPFKQIIILSSWKQQTIQTNHCNKSNS